MYTRKKCKEHRCRWNTGFRAILSVLGKVDRCQALVVAGIKVVCAAVCICAWELVARLVLYIFIVVAHTLVLV